MTKHKLKTWPAYFDAIKRGEKTFEIRRDDRGFQTGDIVLLQRTQEDKKHLVELEYDGKARHELEFKIGWILTGGQFGLEPGYVAFSLQSVK